MSLRETLKAAAEKAAEAAQAEADKPRITSDWKRTVSSFNEQLTEWLAPYEGDGTIAVRKYKTVLHEEYLGRYEVEALELKAGPFIIMIKPIGRMIFGAVGRIDMFRQGKSDENSAVRFLHLKEGDTTAWAIRRPQFKRQGLAVVATPSPLEPLDSKKFEEALDDLIKS